MAKVTAAFIGSLTGFSVQDDGSLVDGATGAVRWTAVSADDEWYLVAGTGYPMRAAARASFAGATALPDGAYEDAAGAGFVSFVSGGWVTAEPGSGPPPP